MSDFRLTITYYEKIGTLVANGFRWDEASATWEQDINALAFSEQGPALVFVQTEIVRRQDGQNAIIGTFGGRFVVEDR